MIDERNEYCYWYHAAEMAVMFVFTWRGAEARTVTRSKSLTGQDVGMAAGELGGWVGELKAGSLRTEHGAARTTR